VARPRPRGRHGAKHVSTAITFLTALGQSLATLSLYGAGHPIRNAAIDKLAAAFAQLMAAGRTQTFTFLDNEVIVGSKPLHDLRGWEWGGRLSVAGVQRIELQSEPAPTSADLDAMLTEIRERLAATGAAAKPWARGGIRLGPVTVGSREPSEHSTVVMDSVVDALGYTGLSAELQAVDYVHLEVAAGRTVPMAEVEAIVHGLALTIRREQDVVLPLLELRTFDEYTTTHACNVSMLAIGLSEALGLSDADARAIGTAALLHDIGKVRVPQELLVKPGKLTANERAEIELHPVHGARILSERGPGNGLNATVAYEHHIWFKGDGGYPHCTYNRSTHYASRIVHVCDIYDSLCSKRPYRDAWPRERSLKAIRAIAGVELDPVIAVAFIEMADHAMESRAHLSEQTA